MTTILTGNAIPLFRLKMMIHGAEMEASGMRLTRGPSCLSMLKRELGLKGNRAKVVAAAKEILEKQKEAS